MKERVYISGPMTGLPGFNFDNFNRVAKNLRAFGYEVLNPAENFSGKTNLPRDEYMRKDLQNVMGVKVIVALDGWTESKGALTEIRVAREIGIDVVDERLNDINKFADRYVFEGTVFDKAKRLVYGDRNKDYGHPGPNFQDTVDMFRVWVKRRYGVDVPFTAKDGVMFMQFVKIAREAHSTKEDNWIDGIGYWGCVSRIEEDKWRK
jgi:hypothetical protein